jgi:hypothetical protein
LKDRVVISVDEVIEVVEKPTEAKKKRMGTDRPWSRPKKNRESTIVFGGEDEDLEYDSIKTIILKINSSG